MKHPLKRTESPACPTLQAFGFLRLSHDWSMPWVSMSHTDSSHMALMTAKAAAKPTPKIQVKYHMLVAPDQ
jgi:hypothetical protein